MRVLFMGTPDIAACCLKGLYAAGHDVCGVFTQPDKPKNRGMKLIPSPVKTVALEHGTPVFQPVKMRDGTARDIIHDLAPELIAVVAYGRILPEDILALPKYGCVNIHGSLLPKYRGSAPIQWTVINGDAVGGLTAMYMAKEMDSGDIIETLPVPVGEYETSGELFDRLTPMASDLLCKVIGDIAAGTAVSAAQDHAAATYAPPLTRDMARIDWNLTARAVCDHIRGYDPTPGAWCEIGGNTYKLFRAVMGGSSAAEPGSVVSTGKTGLEIACADGTVLVTELQAPGGKRMKAADYLRGHSL